ncbi:MAG: outer membrane protein assembly factor BamA [Gemmatimonadota bacterium]
MKQRRHTWLGTTLAISIVAGVSPLWAQETILQVPVDSIVVRGADRYAPGEIAAIAGIRVGAVVNGPDVQEGIRKLFATGDFDDIRVSVTAHEPAVFFIDVVERPLVSRFDFAGLEHASQGTIRDSVGLFGGTSYDPARIARARSMMRKLLANAGFPQARIDTSLVPDPNASGELQVVFRVHEGPRLALARVEFEGNEAFPPSDLQGAMKTVEEGFLWFKPGELHREDYRLDLTERLPSFYAARGYIDFEVLSDTVVVDTTTGKGRVSIRVSEGPQYRLAGFTIEGNRRFPTSELARFFQPVREGSLEGDRELPPFDQAAFDEATGKVADMYRDAGYLQVRVIPDVERIPAAEEGASPTVVARWLIQEGQPAYIRQVSIVGNDFTHDRIIRQVLLTLPGDVYSQQRLIQSIRNLQSLGFFETLPPDQAIQIRPRPDGDVDLVYRVKEKQTGNINFGMSAAAATGFAGFIGYDQPNLFGQAKNGHFRWLFGSRTQDIELTYSDPELLGSNKSATIGLQSSRDRFRTFSLGTRRQTGGFVEIGMPLFRLRSTRFFVGYSLFRDETSDLDAFGVTPDQRQIITQGTRSTFSLRVVRDTRGGGLFPTSGSRNSLSARFTGGALGGSGDYGKYEFESEWFVPVGQIGRGFQSVPIDLTFGLSFKGGLILGDNPFFLERFFVGGTQVGQQLRGYEEATVTPEGHIPRNARFSQLDRVGESFFTTTAQFGVKLNDNVFTSAFLDAGNTWRSAGDFNPTDLLVGAGLGVSLVTPFGPVGIDYAYGFDRRDVLGRPDPGWKLHFRFGRVF